MRSAALLLVAVAALAACTSGSAGTSPQTVLKITLWPNGLSTSETATVWRLRCNPPRGTLPQPARACERLAELGRKVFTPVPPNAICTQIFGGPQVARVIGRVDGRKVWVTISRENGCEISRWNGLTPWLLPKGNVTG